MYGLGQKSLEAPGLLYTTASTGGNTLFLANQTPEQQEQHVICKTIKFGSFAFCRKTFLVIFICLSQPSRCEKANRQLRTRWSGDEW